MTKTVTKHTRASAAGKLIYCPHCGVESRVYHFNWSALVCSCNEVVGKYEYLLERKEQPPDTKPYTYFLNRLTSS